MKKQLTRLALIAGLTASLIAPSLSLAVTTPPSAPIECPGGGTVTAGNPCPLPTTNLKDLTGAQNFLVTITNWMFTFLMVLAVLIFIWAAYQYMFSGGSEEGTSKAKGYLLYGVIAVAVAMLAKGITFLVSSLLGAQSGL